MSRPVKEMKCLFEVCEDIQSRHRSQSAAVFDPKLLIAVQHEKPPLGTMPDRRHSSHSKSRRLILRRSAKPEPRDSYVQPSFKNAFPFEGTMDQAVNLSVFSSCNQRKKILLTKVSFPP